MPSSGKEGKHYEKWWECYPLKTVGPFETNGPLKGETAGCSAASQKSRDNATTSSLDGYDAYDSQAMGPGRAVPPVQCIYGPP